MHDVVIIGAGPAGSAAAFELARRGLDTLLLDKADFPRDKTCGDAVTPRAISMLKAMDILPALAFAQHITEAAVVSPDGARTTADLSATLSSPNYLQIVPRMILDDTLRLHAIACGASFVGTVRVRQVKQHETFVEVSGQQRGQPVSFRARVAIIATGASSELLIQIGIMERLPPVGLAVRAYFDGVVDLIPHQIQFRFDGVPLPGYAWIFPTSPTSANIGLGTFAVGSMWRWLLHPPAPRAVFERWLRAPALRRHLGSARQSSLIKGYPIRTDFLNAPTYGKRVLIVGEAAGLVNPLTGDGIQFALETGRIAAEHLASMFAAGDFTSAQFAAYDRRLRRLYASFFRFCLSFRYLAMSNARALNLLLRTIANYPSVQRWLLIMMFGERLDQPASPPALTARV